MSDLILGTASLTSINQYLEAIRLLDLSYDLGIRTYDTAAMYGRGYSEIILGNFLATKVRSDIQINTKFGLGGDQFTLLPIKFVWWFKNKFSNSSKTSLHSEPSPLAQFKGLEDRIITKGEIERGFENSCRRLRVDYIDCFMLHEALPYFLSDEALSYLLKLKQNGEILKIGIASNCNAIAGLESKNLLEWDILQYEGVFNEQISDQFLGKYTDQIHYRHSCLRLWSESSFEGVSEKNRGGYLLYKCSQANPKGKVIFSTTSMDRLRYNVESFNHYKYSK